MRFLTFGYISAHPHRRQAEDKGFWYFTIIIIYLLNVIV